MEGQLIDVEYVDGYTEICKIREICGNSYKVCTLSYDDDQYAYKWSDDQHTIPREAVSGFYDVSELEDTGDYVKRADGIYYDCLTDSDVDFDLEYDSEETDDDSESEISLYDEQEYEFE